ncbi:4-hydroxy-3-methylbut-2-enyl diphosphate reductase [Truepera radiovictrix]|uniref:4-hydroxy-3-methylbut-2-enyl diphosphate reductase n=1 Tax=Truepera radiovictrix (strain DSM 17093 / CIP 108686 / LMG 22925 / RQ-24) TaxID=649638 RepID=D7CWE4_TRURR|nr:4-hydroxy-3-methylbut-2-enyl diphosphate reductase [Truepera radiovictrix]ADI14343.1 hydroxymethylbutenyl pyrophosphate reductase [Truepera radiovictrix DSM 17093]WMT57099.1 4-hydroxy-3-methylbut-2-enyl diphosphate reductase [Truepera radiovictrix]
MDRTGIQVDTLYLAKPRGFCAGVVMAIQAVEEAAAERRAHGEGLAVYHAIVHNNTVVERLEAEHGVHFVEDLAELAPLREKAAAAGRPLSETVVFSAHGVSPAVRQGARELGLATIDATCPLVTKVHSEAKKYAREGFHILLIGDSSRHQEVIGTKGEAPEVTTVVSVIGNRKHDPDLADPETVTVPDPEKVVVLTQTTLSVDDVQKTIAVLKRRFPALVIPPSDDLCYATKNRQDAVKRIAPHVDLFLVVTSDYSSNGMRLLELAHDLTGNARRIESVRDLRPEWFEGVRSVGVTSAASTPDDLVQDLVAYFRGHNAALRVVEEGEWENIVFRKPKRVPAPVA